MFFTIRSIFPNYKQIDTMECGATCLKMICAFYGKKYNIEDIRNLCLQRKSGISLLGIKKAATSLGFHAVGIKCTLEELKKLPYPCILHWNRSHFVVLYKVRGCGNDVKYYISDPIGFRFKYTEEEISQCWLNQETKAGVVLCLEPTQHFYSSDINSRPQKYALIWFFNQLKYFRPHIANIILGMFCCAIIMLIFPFLTQSIIDYGVSHKDIGFIITILVAQMVMILSSNLIGFIRNWLLLHIGVKVNMSIISEFILKLTKLPIAFFDTKMTGDIIQRIGDHSRIKAFLTDTSINFIFSTITVFIFGAVLFLYNEVVFCIFFIGSFLYVLWVTFFMKRRAVLDNRMFAQNAATQSNIYELIFGMQEIKLCGCETQKRWDWEQIQVKIYQLMKKGLALAQYQESGSIIINQTKNAIITAFVATYTIKGEMTMGMLIAIQFIVGQLNSPIEQFVSFLRKFQDAKLSAQRLNDVYQMQDEIQEDNNLINEIKSQPIIFSNVYFKYDKLSDEDIIKGISFTIPKGKCTAIVGLSGSGKTTLLKMILGFYNPDKGSILIGGQNLKDYNITMWRKKCGVVMQDGFIFSETIAANIATENTSNINMERVKRAARIAHIDTMIDSLAEGYQTKIGVDGKGLSTGQKQRILIARAVYKNPDYILLDEATNSLDANNELAIMNSLHAFMIGRTSIIIAHRLSTVKNADKIIVLNNGIIAEEGSHDELINKKGLYYALVKNQINV